MASQLEASLSKFLSWLSTMRTEQGYWGPVTHYWQDCFQYLGVSPDWKYEGLIAGFLQLYEKTGKEEYLQQATRCGQDILQTQGSNGCFFNSHFENNPSLYQGSTPHEAAACIGLLLLADALRRNNLAWQPYFTAVKKNLEQYHMKVLYDSQAKTFLQDKHDEKHYHVPNKIATIVELLYLYTDFTNDKKYLPIIQDSVNYIISLQAQEQFPGAIYQTEAKKQIITFYVARCIPSLFLHYQRSGYEPALSAALAAREFILTMKLKEGGFAFGYLLDNNGTWQKYTYQVFIAGAGDILRALFLLRDHAPFNVEDIRWLLLQQHVNGSFPTSLGMAAKNTPAEIVSEKSWKDVLPVVGWNDKTFRFLTMVLKQNATLEPSTFSFIEIPCKDGVYSEDQTLMKIEGQYTFTKGQTFRTSTGSKNFYLNLGKIFKSRFMARALRRLLRV